MRANKEDLGAQSLQEAIVELQEAILRVQRLKTLILLVFSMKMEGLGAQGAPGPRVLRHGKAG